MGDNRQAEAVSQALKILREGGKIIKALFSRDFSFSNSIFPEKLTQQFKDFASCEISDGCIMTFDSRLPHPYLKISSLYIRDCYTKIFGLIMKTISEGSRESFCLSGTPGIGKSYFFFYLLHRLARRGRDVYLAAICRIHLFTPITYFF